MDIVTLSRIQFALTIMFHYLFPPLAIGMGGFLVFLEGRFLKSRDPQFEAATKFWTRIFALNFALGVASGIVMEFQFGTNWAAYSRYVGDVFGSALAAEGVFAFFLESGFLAVLVFGWDKVSARMHFFSTLMVALGSIFSAIWIIVAISWQQTPAGFVIRDFKGPGGIVKRAETTEFWSVVFNPSAMDRLVHVLLGAFILGSFFILSISALLPAQEPACRFRTQILFDGSDCRRCCLSCHAGLRGFARTHRCPLSAGQTCSHGRLVQDDGRGRADPRLRHP